MMVPAGVLVAGSGARKSDDHEGVFSGGSALVHLRMRVSKMAGELLGSDGLMGLLAGEGRARRGARQ